MSNRLDQEREKELQPKRMEYAIQEIEKLGYTITYKDQTRIKFGFMDAYVTLFPYSGWFTGKTVKDGRGIEKLLKQIDPKEIK